MLKKRIIPCLDIRDGRTVKGVNFVDIRDAGDPVELAKKYVEQRADELAEGLEANPDGSLVYPDGYHIWFDEIKYARLGNITIFRASMPSVTRQYFVGSTVTLQGTSTIFRVDGAPIPVSHSPDYFDYISSDPTVATVSGGRIIVQGVGTATITAKLDTLDVIGRVILAASCAADRGRCAAGAAGRRRDLHVQRRLQRRAGGHLESPLGGSTTQDEIYVIAGDNTPPCTRPSTGWASCSRTRRSTPRP